MMTTRPRHRRRHVHGAGLRVVLTPALLLVTWSVCTAIVAPGGAWAEEPRQAGDVVADGFDLGERVTREIGSTPTAEAHDAGDAEVDDEALELDIAPSAFLLPAPDHVGFERAFRVEGYVDLGFYAPFGDGAGHILDVGNVLFPGFDGIPWVFLGDPLATAVNSRGEPADTGGESNRSRALDRDLVDSGGEPGVIVNELNLDLLATFTPDLVGLFSVDLAPRVVGDTETETLTFAGIAEIDRAFLEWTLHASREATVAISVGRFDGVLGREYRVQESDDRFGVTPSLMFRYLGGHPIGVKARGSFLDDSLTASVAFTDRSGFVDLFHLGAEQPRYPRVGSLRVAYLLDVLGGIEVGASGLVGAQDGQDDPAVIQWQFGGDLYLAVWRFEIEFEYQRGRAVGEDKPGAPPCAESECIEFESVYGQVVYRIMPWLGVLARVDWRDALHEKGNDFVYVTNLIRYTVGIRIPIVHRAIAKLEYVHVDEIDDSLGPMPDFDNDVFTSSFVVTF